MEQNGAEGLLCVLMKSTRLLTCKLEMAAITQWISTSPYSATVDNFIFSILRVHELMRGYMYLTKQARSQNCDQVWSQNCDLGVHTMWCLNNSWRDQQS